MQVLVMATPSFSNSLGTSVLGPTSVTRAPSAANAVGAAADVFADYAAEFLDSHGADHQLHVIESNLEPAAALLEQVRILQPRLLVIWGKHDLSFDLGEPERYRKDVPDAQIHVLDASHFALDTKADEIAACRKEGIGFEVVQKAAAAGVGALVSVGAPSSLAVEFAASAGLELYGFTSADRCVRYT